MAEGPVRCMHHGVANKSLSIVNAYTIYIVSKLKNICNVNVARIARKSAKKRRNKKFGECITPIRYNIIHMYCFNKLYNYYFCFGTFPGQSFHIAYNYYSDVDGDVYDNDVHFFQAIVYYVCMMLSLTVLRKHASVGCVGGSISSLFMTMQTHFQEANYILLPQ